MHTSVSPNPMIVTPPLYARVVPYNSDSYQEAYKVQNMFLGSEIYLLTKRDHQVRERLSNFL